MKEQLHRSSRQAAFIITIWIWQRPRLPRSLNNAHANWIQHKTTRAAGQSAASSARGNTHGIHVSRRADPLQ